MYLSVFGGVRTAPRRWTFRGVLGAGLVLAVLLVTVGVVPAISGSPTSQTLIGRSSPAMAPSTDARLSEANSLPLPKVVGPVALGSHAVQFGLRTALLSAVYVPRVSIANGSLPSGNGSRATVRFSGTSATISLTLLGLAPADVTLPALGVQEAAVPGLNYSVAGVPLSIYIDLTGAVNGTSFVGPNGTGGGVAFSWTAPGNLSIPFTATGPAPSRVEVGVANLSYVLSVAVVARGTAAGIPVSVDLISPVALPAATGTPANVAGVFEILALGPGAHPRDSSPSLPLPGGLWLVAAAILAALTLGTFVGWRLRHRSLARPASPRVCAYCGAPAPWEASFCASCARPLRPAPTAPGPRSRNDGPPPDA
ncbi:MAG: hypothetical protein L3J95_02490 [Thermoplasmata archaeon]|nr:hypothetical protein [Thermoplasmata archaeon]